LTISARTSAIARVVRVAAVVSLFASVAVAQDAARVQPKNYRVVIDNNKVRVLEFRSQPGKGICGIGLHSHPAHLTVLLTPAKVRETINGKTREIESKAGDAFWSPAVTHIVEDYSGQEVRSLIIEVKTPRSSR
jgi:hypothetical protein